MVKVNEKYLIIFTSVMFILIREIKVHEIEKIFQLLNPVYNVRLLLYVSSQFRCGIR